MNSLQSPEKVRVLAVSEIKSHIDFVIHHYHCGAKKYIVLLYDLAKKVAGKHREEHPELAKQTTALFLFFDALSFHSKKEEQSLFPTIRQLIEKSAHAESFIYTTGRQVEESVRALEKEHLGSVSELKFIRGLTNNYSIPAGAPESHAGCHNGMLVSIRR
jgi:regulator of cell morphogenesis and NO signaling